MVGDRLPVGRRRGTETLLINAALFQARAPQFQPREALNLRQKAACLFWLNAVMMLEYWISPGNTASLDRLRRVPKSGFYRMPVGLLLMPRPFSN